jgi:hypothetical protein
MVPRVAAPLAPAYAPGEALVVRDVTGALVTYTMKALRGWIIPDDCNDRDARAFIQFCTTSGANPFIKEAYCVTYKGKGSSMFGVAYFYRRAHESGQFDGMEATLLDAAGKPLPKTAEMKLVAAAGARAYRKDQRLPVEEVVTLKEARKAYGDFWGDDEKAKHQLLKTAKMRALYRAFPPAAGGVFAQLPRALAPEDLEEETVQARVVAVREDASPSGLSLADFGKWCAAEGVAKDDAEKAKTACGLGAHEWKALEKLPGMMEMVRGKVLQLRDEAEGPDPDDTFAQPAETASAPLPSAPEPQEEPPPITETEADLKRQIGEYGAAIGWKPADVKQHITAALEDGPDGLVAARDDLRAKAEAQPKLGGE